VNLLLSLGLEVLPYVPVACLVLLLTPFRKCILIGPILLTAAFGGYIANMVLWKVTGGELGRVPDLIIPRHAPGTATPASFMPLWTLTLVVIVGTVISLSVIILRLSIRDYAQHMARIRTSAHEAGSH
jgi:hypothetical protein